MAYPAFPKAHDLHATMLALQDQLEKLDHMGAGIAAIHVNAAIEQLRTNLAIVNDNGTGPFDPSLLCVVPEEDTDISKGFQSARD